MNTIQMKILGAAVFFALIFLSGFFLSRAGRPYAMLIFTAHKLIAVGVLVFIGVTAYQMHQAAPLAPAQLAAVIFCGLCFVATIATGGLVSLEKEMPLFVQRLHHGLPWLTALSSAAALYFLLASQAGIAKP